MKKTFSGVFVLVLVVTALALGARVAQADSGLFYFGAGITSNHANHVEPQGYDNHYFPNIDSTSWKVFAGIRPISPFAVEADYFDLGSQANTVGLPLSCVSVGTCATVWKSDAKAFAGYAVGFLPTPAPYLDVYGKAGLAYFKLNGTITYYNAVGVSNGSASYPDNSTVFAWGAGVQAHIGKIGGRLEYEGFNKASAQVLLALGLSESEVDPGAAPESALLHLLPRLRSAWMNRMPPNQSVVYK